MALLMSINSVLIEKDPTKLPKAGLSRSMTTIAT